MCLIPMFILLSDTESRKAKIMLRHSKMNKILAYFVRENVDERPNEIG